ncbi:hypothetical protein [Paraburkholderia sp. C35]|uniref:hypothetical protein n=1 Tax=Paraburkholderia sp. C35 TaxID=2126993 RepID=UPI000D698313|nr:hypothetical protein [Paraburkholderia sp. C35]
MFQPARVLGFAGIFEAVYGLAIHLREHHDVDIFEMAILDLVLVVEVAPSGETPVAVDYEAVVVEQDRIDLLVVGFLEELPKVRLVGMRLSRSACWASCASSISGSPVKRSSRAVGFLARYSTWTEAVRPFSRRYLGMS